MPLAAANRCGAASHSHISFAGFHPAEADLVVSPLNLTYDLGDIRLPLLEGFTETVNVAGEARAEAMDSLAAENTLPVSLDYTRPMRAGRLELGIATSPTPSHASSPSTIPIRTTTSSTGYIRTRATLSRPACRCCSSIR